jgi:uncharacterized protein (DUF1697 family)
MIRFNSPMPKYVAFLRAINVGGRTVKMDHLRSLFEALGFSNVETFIASGNVIFDSTSKSTKSLEKKIKAHLLATLGYEVATFIRSTSELAGIADFEPFAGTELKAEGNTLYIGFLEDLPSNEAKEKVLSVSTEINDFTFSGCEFFWLCRKSFSESNFSGASLEKLLGMRTTLRNSTTVRKIALKYR